MGSVVVVHRLSYPKACEILVLQPGIKPMSSALPGRFLTTGPPGKSLKLAFNYKSKIILQEGFPGGSVVKNLPSNARDAGGLGSVPGSRRAPGGGNGSPLQSSCLEDPMDRGAWRATVHSVAESDKTEGLSTQANLHDLKLIRSIEKLWKSSLPTYLSGGCPQSTVCPSRKK